MLQLTNNSKTRFKKGHMNTFGLMYGLPENGGTCPGATCGKGGCLDVKDGNKLPTCYMSKVTTAYKAVGNVLAKNTDMLKDKSVDEMTVILKATIQEFIRKNKGDLLYFRLHYSGDFYSVDYAKAWVAAMLHFPNVHFWVYTRSFRTQTEIVESLLTVPNLTLFLSADEVNSEKALEIYEKYKDNHNNLGLAWLGNEPPDKEKYRWVTCPELSGKVKNTAESGACAKCKLCVNNYKVRVKNIHFPPN